MFLDSNPSSEQFKSKGEKKFIKLLEGLNSDRKKDRKLIREHILKGKIPPKSRKMFWQIALGTQGKMECKCTVNYQELLRAPVPYAHIVQLHQDLDRTLRPHINYVDRYGEGQRKLFRIMRAYCAYSPSLGYGQGMCTLGAILLNVIEDELETFYALVSLFENYTFGELYGLTGGSMSGLLNAFDIFGKLLSNFFPKIKQGLDETPIPPDFYLTQWFLELFYGRIPFWLCIRLWDLFLLDGYSAVFSFTLSLFAANEDHLTDLNSLEKFNPFKESPCEGIDIDKVLLWTTTKFKLTPNKIETLTTLTIQNHMSNVKSWSDNFFL
uniref:Rab-GAP TBC domain-containing protein n=1 Tax=Arcella intermedia TaxID=1963864 RepID=A0A6B2L7K4_9EUKA